MNAKVYFWTSLPEDNPIPLLNRSKLETEKVLAARIKLGKGCRVALHSHESEQIAIILSGKALWTLGADGSPDQHKVEVTGGQVVHLPSFVPHGVEALEDTEVIDILCPPGPMGVDSQK
jgi:quercetin dioxygenase-like cupin family protein